MASDTDPYEGAVSMMEDALEMLDALGASLAAAHLDQAIYAVPGSGGSIRKRRQASMNIDAADETSRGKD